MTATALSFLMMLAGGITADEFRGLHGQLQPSQEEVWRTIPWKVSLLEAREQALQEQKPIFIWAMDGHPLGCT